MVFYPTNLIEEKNRKIGKYFYDLAVNNKKLCYVRQLEKEYKINRRSTKKDLEGFSIPIDNKIYIGLNKKDLEDIREIIKLLKKQKLNLNKLNALRFVFIYIYKTLRKGQK